MRQKSKIMQRFDATLMHILIIVRIFIFLLFF